MTRDVDPTLPSPRDPNAGLVGTVLDGCRIVRLLGHGGMGAVYEGHEEMADRRVAVKTIRADLVDSPDQAIRRFRNEIRAVAKISSPHVVQLYHAGEIPADAAQGAGGIYMRMQFVDGRDLSEELGHHPGGRVPLDQAIAWMTDAARGLLAAEQAGVVHRDIKPANLMLGQDGRVLVADFGIATLEDARTRLTGENIIGTVLYMAPEQFEGVEADVRSDIYSLGATFFHAVTGKPPAEGATTAEVMRQKTTAKCTLSPRSGLGGADTAELQEKGLAPFDALIRRMTARDPSRRPQSFAEVIDALEAMARGEAVRPKPAWVAPVVTIAAVGVLAVVYLIATGAFDGTPEIDSSASKRQAAEANATTGDASKESDGNRGEGTDTPDADPDPVETPEPGQDAGGPEGGAEAKNPGKAEEVVDGATPDADPDAAGTATVEPDPDPGPTDPSTAVGTEASKDPQPETPEETGEPAAPAQPEGPPRADLARWAQPEALAARGAEPTWHIANRYGVAFPSSLVDQRRGVTMVLVRWDRDRGGEGDGTHWFYADTVEASARQWAGLAAGAAVAGADDLLPATSITPEEILAALTALEGPTTSLPSLDQWKRMAFGPLGRRTFPWGEANDPPTGIFREATYGPDNQRQTVTGEHEGPERVGRTGERNPEGLHGLCTNVREVVRHAEGYAAVGASFAEKLWTEKYRRDRDDMAATIRDNFRSPRLGFRAVVPIAALVR